MEKWSKMSFPHTKGAKVGSSAFATLRCRHDSLFLHGDIGIIHIKCTVQIDDGGRPVTGMSVHGLHISCPSAPAGVPSECFTFGAVFIGRITVAYTDVPAQDEVGPGL